MSMTCLSKTSLDHAVNGVGVETYSLPSKSDLQRKRSIIEYVVSTRRQTVKLLVLLRWAKENTQETEQAINIIAFLQRQNYQLERTVETLKGVKDLLTGAR